MSDAEERERLGRALSDHEIGRVLGRGQFGVVWSARHMYLAREVAVKRLDDQIAADPEHSARFRREARTLARLDHKHVVAVHDYKETEGMRLLIMELLKGGTLADRRSRGMPIETAIASTMAAASGLYDVHQSGVLHRDIKPENLMFDEAGVLKVTDFGLARGDNQRDTAINLSRAGTFFGTPAYIAPEQAAAALAEGWPDVAEAADQYSLAAVLYESISGELTHDPTGGGIVLCTRRMNEEARQLTEVAPGTPVPVAAVVMRALARDPSQRFATIEDFAVALGRAANESLGADWLERSEVGIREPGAILDAAKGNHVARPWGASAAPAASGPPLPPVEPVTQLPPPSAERGSAAYLSPLPEPQTAAAPSTAVPSTAVPSTPPSIAPLAAPPSHASPAPPADHPTEQRRSPLLMALSAVIVVALGAGAMWFFTRDGEREAGPTVTDQPAGATGETELPLSVDETWSFPTAGNVFASPALTADRVIVGSEDGSLYSVDRASGAQAWKYDTGDSIRSSATIADTTTVVGSDDGYVHAVDTVTGTKKWATPLKYEVVSSPAIANNVVTVGADRLYGLDLTTGAEKWRFDTDGVVVSSPVIDDATVVVGSTGGTLYGVDLNTGTQRWAVDLGGAIQASPKALDGRVYVGTISGDLHAVSIADGSSIWTAELGGEIKSSALATPDVVVVGTVAGRLEALETSTGEPAWTWAGNRPIDSSPAAGDGWIAVGTNDNSLVLVDTASGQLLGAFSTGAPVVSSPRVDGASVYVGSHDDKLYALSVEGTP